MPVAGEKPRVQAEGPEDRAESAPETRRPVVEARPAGLGGAAMEPQPGERAESARVAARRPVVKPQPAGRAESARVAARRPVVKPRPAGRGESARVAARRPVVGERAIFARGMTDRPVVGERAAFAPETRPAAERIGLFSATG
jgi:hypothetical protein